MISLVSKLSRHSSGAICQDPACGIALILDFVASDPRWETVWDLPGLFARPFRGDFIKATRVVVTQEMTELVDSLVHEFIYLLTQQILISTQVSMSVEKAGTQR